MNEIQQSPLTRRNILYSHKICCQSSSNDYDFHEID